jgi:hypothetical protein
MHSPTTESDPLGRIVGISYSYPAADRRLSPSVPQISELPVSRSSSCRQKDLLPPSRLLQNRLTTEPELPRVTILEVSHEVRVISSKKEALQALSIPKNLAWNRLTFRIRKIHESVDRGGNTLVNQRIRLCQFGVAFCCRPKGSKLLDGVLPLF